MLVLGIDVGTSGVRSAVLDETGAIRSFAQSSYELQKSDKVDADNWWAAVKRCIFNQKDAMCECGLDPLQIRAAAIDGTSASMVLVDEKIKPVTQALMYNSSGFDREALQIAPHAPADHITRGANSALGRLLRLQSLDHEMVAVKLCHQADFILAKMTGLIGTSDYNNALKTGFDPQTNAWPNWLADAGVDTKLLPKVFAPGEALSVISSDVAAELGLSKQLILHAGTTDSIAAFLATGASEIGTAVTSIGTTLALKVLSDKRIDKPSIGLYSHRINDMWLAGGASNSGGGVLLKYFSLDEIAALSECIDPLVDSKLDYYPLTMPGERFPFNDPDFQPKLDPRPENDALFLQGMLEGIGKIEAAGYEALANLGAPASNFILTAGGGAKNMKWSKIRERILNRKVLRAPHDEAAIGVAKLCL